MAEGVVEGEGVSRYTQRWRGGRVVECGGLENRYVGKPGVGGSNPPLSATEAYQRAALLAAFSTASGFARRVARRSPGSRYVECCGAANRAFLADPLVTSYHAGLWSGFISGWRSRRAEVP